MKNKIIFISTIIIFRILIDWIYKYEIVPLFDYTNFNDYSTRESFIFSWLYLAFFIPLVLWITEDCIPVFSQLIAVFIIFLRIIPFTSLMMYRPQNVDYVSANFVYWGLFLFLLKKTKSQNPFKLLKDDIKDLRIIKWITIVIVATVVIVSGVYCNFRIHLSLDDVYDLRMEAREFNMPKILAYLQAASSNLIPILIIYYISNKKTLPVFLLAFIGLLNFSIAGHKSTLFKIILCLFLYFSPKVNIKKYLPLLFISICLLSIIEYVWFDTANLSTIIVRRGFYVPASLDVSYYDYIIQHGPTYFQEGIAFKIGMLSGNDAKMCNNGLFSDAFMNLGYLGCVVFPFIVVYFTKIVEFISQKSDYSIKLFSAFIIVFTLVSSYFTTSMLTHGLFLLCVTLYYLPKVDK